MASLRVTQSRFAFQVSRLIAQAYTMGYEVTLGDAYRDPRVFGALGTKQGYGHPRSAHKQRLDRVSHTLAGYDMASKEAAAQPAETRAPAADAAADTAAAPSDV